MTDAHTHTSLKLRASSAIVGAKGQRIFDDPAVPIKGEFGTTTINTFRYT